jgi:WD40 repeat protein
VGDHITGIAISGDGRFVAVSSFLGDVYYLDVNGNLLWNRSGLGCDTRVFVTRDGLKGYVFNFLSGENYYQFHPDGTISLEKSIPSMILEALTPDGTYLVGSLGAGFPDYNTDIALLSVNGTVLWRHTLPEVRYQNVAISDDGDTIVAATRSHGIYIFNRQGTITANITPNYDVMGIAVSPDGRLIAAGTTNKYFCYESKGTPAWNYTTGDYIFHTAFSGDGRYLAAATDKMVYFFDRSGTLLWNAPLSGTDPLERIGVSGVSVSHDGDVVAVWTWSNTIYLFDREGNWNRIRLGNVNAVPLPAVAVAPPSPSPSRTPVPSMAMTPPTTKPVVLPATISIGALVILIPAGFRRKKGNNGTF